MDGEDKQIEEQAGSDNDQENQDGPSGCLDSKIEMDIPQELDVMGIKWAGPPQKTRFSGMGWIERISSADSIGMSGQATPAQA